MKTSKKKKVLLLGLLSSLTIAGSALAVVLTSKGTKFSSKAGDKAPGSVVFSRESGQFTRISDTVSSTSGTTSNGATYYAIAHSNADVQDTGYIAQFGSGVAQDEQYIKFSSSPTVDEDFKFQRLTGIKITVSSGTAQTLYAYYSDDGVNFSSYHSISCSSNPEKFEFSQPHKYVRIGEYSTYGRDISKIELFYECSSDPEPEEKEIDRLEFGSMKTNYVLGDEFQEPEVIAYYTDSTHETVNATFSVPDMTKEGKQTVTATYGTAHKDFTIEVWPSATAERVVFKGLYLGDYSEQETSAFLKDTSVLPLYGEPGETVQFTPVFKDAFMYTDVYENDSLVEDFDLDGSNVSFVMPNSGVIIYIVYQDNPYKSVTFAGFDYGTFDDQPDVSVFLEDSSVLPSKGIPGDTVSFTLVPKSGVTLYGADDQAGDVTITENAGTYSFTMPSGAIVVLISYYQEPVLESISVSDPKTIYAVGSDFVAPKVMGHYSNGGSAALDSADVQFSGFNSASAVEGQVITVSVLNHEGVDSITYSINIVEGLVHTLYGTYTYTARLNSGDNEFRLIFNSDGTGAFERDFTPDSTGVKESYGLNFTYDDSSGTTFSVTLVSFYDGTPHANSDEIRTSFFTRYIFIYANSETTNSTGVINENGSIKIKLTSATSTSAGSFYTFSK